MAELRDEFSKGKIVLAHIESESEVIDGLCETGSGLVIVDEVPNTVETLLHELLHRRYPRWGEKRVSLTATRLMHAMDHAERRAWYRALKRAATRLRAPMQVD